MPYRPNPQSHKDFDESPMPLCVVNHSGSHPYRRRGGGGSCLLLQNIETSLHPLV